MNQAAVIVEKSAAQQQQRAMHYVIWRSAPGGMESYISAYAAHFKATRRTFLYSLRPSPNDLTDDVDGFQQGAESNGPMYRGYYRYCRQYRKEGFHLLNSGPMILLITLLAGVRRPIYHIHGTKYWKGPRDRWALWLVWQLTRAFRITFIANSKYSATLFKQNANPAPALLIYNGFETGPLLAGRRQRTSLKRMAYAGRLAHGKNAHLVIDLFNAVADRYPELELHIAGTGSLEHALMDEALKSPYRKRILFHGWVSDMTAFYSSVDLIVFPSAHESFGNVLAECLLNGLPVLVSDVPVFEEIHGDTQTFCIGSPLRPDAFRTAFVAALERYDHLAEKAYAAAERVAERFNMPDHLRAIELAYESA